MNPFVDGRSLSFEKEVDLKQPKVPSEPTKPCDAVAMECDKVRDKAGDAEFGNRGAVPTTHRGRCPGGTCRRTSFLGMGRESGRCGPPGAITGTHLRVSEMRIEVCLRPSKRGSVPFCPPTHRHIPPKRSAEANRKSPNEAIDGTRSPGDVDESLSLPGLSFPICEMGQG